MADEAFAVNLMKMLAAQMHFQSTLLVSREMFGKSYFSLGQAEKIAVDQASLGHIAANYNEITPELLAGQGTRQPAGFGIPKDAPSTNPSASGAAS